MMRRARVVLAPFLTSAACLAIVACGEKEPLGIIGEPVLQEDFSDNEAGWDESMTNAGNFEFVDGVFRITGYWEACMSEPGYAPPIPLYTDFMLSTDAAFVEGGAEDGFGLTWGAYSQNWAYYFLINSAGDYSAGIRKGDPEPYIDWRPHDAIRSGTETNHLRVSRTINWISLYANNRLVDRIPSDPFIDDSYGLMVLSEGDEETMVQFDNFEARVASDGPSEAEQFCLALNHALSFADQQFEPLKRDPRAVRADDPGVVIRHEILYAMPGAYAGLRAEVQLDATLYYEFVSSREEAEAVAGYEKVLSHLQSCLSDEWEREDHTDLEHPSVTIRHYEFGGPDSPEISLRAILEFDGFYRTVMSID